MSVGVSGSAEGVPAAPAAGWIVRIEVRVSSWWSGVHPGLVSLASSVRSFICWALRRGYRRCVFLKFRSARPRFGKIPLPFHFWGALWGEGLMNGESFP